MLKKNVYPLHVNLLGWKWKMPCLEIFIYFIIPILLGTCRHLTLLEKDVPVSVVRCPRPIRSTCFAVNLVRKTGARSVYAANTSQVIRVSRPHCTEPKGSPCFYSLWRKVVSLAMLQRHPIVIEEMSLYFTVG